MEALYGGMHVSVPRVSKCASIPSGSKVECKCNGMDMEQYWQTNINGKDYLTRIIVIYFNNFKHVQIHQTINVV